jgi:hypothetical protein
VTRHTETPSRPRLREMRRDTRRLPPAPDYVGARGAQRSARRVNHLIPQPISALRTPLPGEATALTVCVRTIRGRRRSGKRENSLNTYSEV